MKYPTFDVDCGHCLACKIRRSREWSLRCFHESSYWKKACFVTLTYDQEHLPKDLGLEHDALTNFFKRMRKDGYKFSYYACGEYGSQTYRPHYHALMFGVGCEDAPRIQDNWPFGNIKVGTVSQGSIEYVCGYVQKKLYGDDAEVYEKYGILPPFSRMSKHIGYRYCQDNKDYILQNYTVRYRGRDVPIPRYYRETLNICDADFYASLEDKQLDKDLETLEKAYSNDYHLPILQENMDIPEEYLSSEIIAQVREKENIYNDVLTNRNFKLKLQSQNKI